MGTSGAYPGPKGKNPLVPTWADGDEGGDPVRFEPTPPEVPPADVPVPAPIPAAPPDRNPLPPGEPDRFTVARKNLSRFAASGGTDRRSLGRAVSGYVSKSAGGARQAARRMGASSAAGSRLLGFLIDAQARGTREALRSLDLEGLAGRPIEDIFLGLSEFVCPDGGTVDEGIAREAFIETIADLATFGISDLDALTPDQMQTVFELYATHAIEARLCNDIGDKTIAFPIDVRTAERVQTQLRDFIRRGIADALTSARGALKALTPASVFSFVGTVYETAFGILQTMGEAAADER